MRAVLYTRVSTATQANEGVSLDTQATKLRQYCDLNDFEITEIITDSGISGKNTNRPGYKKVMELVKTKAVDVVIVYSLSRFARNTVDTLAAVKTLNKSGVSFHSLTENLDTSSAIGRFFVTTLAALAELEREQLSERTKAALQHKKSKNERTGQIPFGKQLASDGLHLEDNEQEQKVIRLVLKLRSGGLSYAKIAKELENRNLQNKSGVVKWSDVQIIRIIKKAA